MKASTSAAGASLMATPSMDSSTPRRLGIFAYGVTCYLLGVGGLCWLIGVTFGLIPLTGGPLAIESTPLAILFNLGLVASFGTQHAIMARPGFKARWTRIIPQPMERPTFVLLAGLLMANAMWLWQPLETSIWSVQAGAVSSGLTVLGAFGWAYFFAATFAIDHFELLGLRQVWNQLHGLGSKKGPVVTRWMYRFDRHPLMSGVMFGIWAKPEMTLGHLILALGFSAYIVVGVSIEERDLVRAHGDSYREYRRRVGTLIPGLRRAS